MNMQEQKVTIKGKLDPKVTCETVKKKSGKRTVLIYPDPKKLEEDQKKATEEDPKKAEPPPVKKQTLKISLSYVSFVRQGS